MEHKVLVIGCGIIGLTTGLTLLHQGHEVIIISKQIPPHTTSNAAGAFWSPVTEEPIHSDRNELAWATHKYVGWNYVCNEESGCVERDIDVYYKLPSEAPHPDAAKLPFFQHIAAESIPQGIECAGGFSFKSYVVDTDVHLNFLVNQFVQEGGKIVEKELRNLKDVLHIYLDSHAHYDAIVNCSGLGAKDLFGDETVFPIRGQTLIIHPMEGVDRIKYLDRTDPAYVIPRKTNCVLGGTWEVGNGNVEPSEEDTNAILQKAALLGVKDPSVRNVKVGIRPGRASLRLGPEWIKISDDVSILVVHNYGHGGRGFTLSWGCAEKVAKILDEELRKHTNA